MSHVDYTFGTSLSDAKPMISTKEPSNRIYTAAPKPIRSAANPIPVVDLTLVDSGNPALYACLRISDNNAVLVLVNPRNKDISNYSLSIQVSDLYAGTYDVIPLFGDAIINKKSVLVNEKGGFINYKPVDKLPAYGTLILKLN
jgi:hypothetical protein